MRTNAWERTGPGRTGHHTTRKGAANLVSCGMGGLLCSILLAGCGETVRPLGVLVNRAGVTKELVEAAVGAPPPMPVDVRVRDGNVIGDITIDRVSTMSGGKGVQVRDGGSGQMTRIPIGEYLTDIALIPEAGSPIDDVLVATYPNPDRGGSVRVYRLPDVAPKVVWQDTPAAGHVGIAPWKGEPGIFYFQPDAIVVRAPDSRVLARIVVPGAFAFRYLHPGVLADGRTVILASGNGYTPYHMVAVIDAQGVLVFHEQADEHAWRLTVGSDGKTFDVDTRSKRWRYKTN